MWWKSLASLARVGHRPDHAVSQAQEIQGVVADFAIAPIRIVSVGFEPPDWDVLGPLSVDIARTFQTPCRIEESHLDPRFAYDPERDQYYSTAILEKLSRVAARFKGSSRILGAASVDLYVPILTFVYGEAQLHGACAVVSSYRLPEPGRPELLRERLLKESTHELGHTYGLRHCEDWNCVMASSHSVERLDIKSAEFCPRCVKTIRQHRGHSRI